MMRWVKLGLAVGAMLLLSPGTAHAQAVSFSKDIAPIFKDQCLGCHNAKQSLGEFSLATYASLEKGGKGGKVLAPKAADSRLVKYLEGTLKPQMPPGGALPKAQIELIKRWVDQGAKIDIPRGQSIGGADGAPEVKVPKIDVKVPVLPQTAALAWSKDGKLVAVGTYKVVRLVDPESGQTVRELKDHADVVLDLEFSPDGKLLAAAGGPPAQGGEIKVWDVASGQLVRTITGHDDCIYSCSWSADGKMLASGSYDKVIKLWDANTGEELKTLKDHADAVYAVAFNPAGNLLASASADRSVKVWDVASGKRIYTLSGHGDIVFSVAWNAAGNQLTSAGADKTVRTWNVNAQNGNQARNTNAHGKTVTQVTYSADGKMLASVSEDRSVKIWNAANGQTMHTVGDQSDALLSVTFSPDNKLVAVGGYDGSVKLYNVEDGKLVRTLIEAPKTAEKADGAKK